MDPKNGMDWYKHKITFIHIYSTSVHKYEIYFSIHSPSHHRRIADTELYEYNYIIMQLFEFSRQYYHYLIYIKKVLSNGVSIDPPQHIFCILHNFQKSRKTSSWWLANPQKVILTHQAKRQRVLCLQADASGYHRPMGKSEGGVLEFYIL